MRRISLHKKTRGGRAMTCDHDYDHWQIVVELNGFTMADYLSKEKPASS